MPGDKGTEPQGPTGLSQKTRYLLLLQVLGGEENEGGAEIITENLPDLAKDINL